MKSRGLDSCHRALSSLPSEKGKRHSLLWEGCPTGSVPPPVASGFVSFLIFPSALFSQAVRTQS